MSIVFPITIPPVGKSLNNQMVRQLEEMQTTLNDTTSGVVTLDSTQTIAGTKTFSGQLIGKGTATNDNAAAGYIGEVQRNFVDTGSAINMGASGVFGNITTISLTAGDWDVTGIAVILIGTATGSLQSRGVISINSGNTTTDHVDGDNVNYQSPPAANVPSFCIIPNYRLSLSSPTTVYLKSALAYGAGQPTTYGRISARRVR